MQKLLFKKVHGYLFENQMVMNLWGKALAYCQSPTLCNSNLFYNNVLYP